ncbi:MAG: DNA-processing protein DprA [Candidatus Paceibacterota bacterium]
MSFNIKKINFNNIDYPTLLKEIPSPPKNVFYKGKLINNRDYCIGIIGTRRAKKHGLDTARKMAQDLANLGFIIVSGLALGIDGEAHRGALSVKGRTVAVLANGLDKIYPPEHKKLADDILNNKGLIISEYPEGTPSYKNNFLARNRIISGLSKAIIVVESPYKSGAMSTATHAANQGREVFVIPGQANDSLYKGSHSLIRDGARLVTSSEDVLKDLGFDVKNIKINE